MNLKRGIEIFREQRHYDADWVIDTIRKVNSLDELKQVMIDEHTGSSADQFVSLIIRAMFEGDPDFAEKTLADAKKKFSEYGLPEEIVDYYISNGGGVDKACVITGRMDLNKFPKVPEYKLSPFYDVANDHLFRTLKEYVANPPS